MCGVSFGSANAATQPHAANQPHNAMQPHQHQSSSNILPAVEAYMENISVAATTNHATPDAFVTSNAHLSTTTEN